MQVELTREELMILDDSISTEIKRAEASVIIMQSCGRDESSDCNFEKRRVEALRKLRGRLLFAAGR